MGREILWIFHQTYKGLPLKIMEKYIIRGSYGNRLIKIHVRKSLALSNYVTIFVHGLYGFFNENDINDKVYILAKKLTEESVSNVICYESSRDFSFDGSLSYEKRQESFKEKTFTQELNDLKKVIDYIIDNSEKLFGIKKKNLILNLHGNSIGGTIILMLTKYFPYIRKISLCGTGCGRGTANRPIQSTTPDESILLDSISKYSGELFLLQGSKDNIVPLESGIKILNHAKRAKIIHREIEGANHNFSKINEVETREATNIFVNEIFDFLKNKTHS